MKHRLTVALAFATLALAILPVVSAASQQIHASGTITEAGGLILEQAAPTREPSCASPTWEMIAGCSAQVKQIMASTVRLEISRSDRKFISHATVAGGRYLITHNHFPIDWSDARRTTALTVTLLRADGSYVIRHAPLSIFTIIAEDPETLILDFHESGGTGYFDLLGIPSVALKRWDEMPVRVGDEVAQVRWDGAYTSIQWARVSFINDDPSVPGLEMESSLRHGASGGGVFIDGHHIGNNWTNGTNYRPSPESASGRYSVAALNTASVTSLNPPSGIVLLLLDQ